METKDQILDALKEQIANFKTSAKVEKIGHVIEVGDGIARISGLSNVASQEMVEFTGGQVGVALNLEEDTVGVIILGSDKGIKEGDEIHATGKILSLPVGEALIGRVVDPLGRAQENGVVVPDERLGLEGNVPPGLKLHGRVPLGPRQDGQGEKPEEDFLALDRDGELSRL